MKVVVTGGGTGGHVYPALTVLDTLTGSTPADRQLPVLGKQDILWLGSKGGLEEGLVEHHGLTFTGLAAGGLRGVGMLNGARNALRIGGSIGQAGRILGRFKPDAILATGGYACVSVVVAGWLRGIPVLIYLPDIVPGLAIRYLSRFANRVAVTSPESYRYFPREKVVVTGYPVRAEVFKIDQAQARESLGLDAEQKTLLVFGGSRGARSINQALTSGLRDLLPICQIIHVSGRLDADWVAGAAKKLPEQLRDRYHHFDYMHDMPRALVAADLVVARAGAATMGEFPAAELPSVLVPYPHSGQHQNPNAAYMAENGAARVLADAELAEKLTPLIAELLCDGQDMAAMRESARSMARPDAAEAIAEQLWLMAREQVIRTSARMTKGEKREGSRP
jgi:UDP-N-acetylglucosamine--N-acetylmuramyl-(pentapeptide) pyrophosphoryl-undecaprenol N-acetylglucosamine transferase